MTDDATAQDKASSKRTKREARRAFSLGRRIALAIYWAFALYMAGVGFWSIPKQIFFPPRGGSQSSALFETCREGVTSLLSQLTRSEEIDPPAGHDRSEQARFFSAWDDNYAGLRPICSGEDAYADLERLRYRVESAHVRYEREQAPLIQTIKRELSERSSR